MMTRNQLHTLLWIAFTLLLFVVFCGASFLIFRTVDWAAAILFFVVIAIVDKKGIGHLADYCTSELSRE